MTALADSIWNVSLSEMAADRGMPIETLKEALESGPKTAQQVIDLKIMDKLGWPEEAEDAAKERAGKDAELVELAGYIPPSISLKAPLIAVVGGSPTASDQIWRAIKRVQEKGKPVVVSMGSLAASGGYYVSAGADYIMADRSTITGSIGIFGGKFALEGAFNKIGVTFDTVSVGGDFADAYGTGKFTESQEAEVKAWLKRGYDRFLGIVGDGRGMTYDQVNEVARGRVWSGEDAIDKGLVDEIGGFMDAIEKAKELGGIEADVTPRLTYYPRRKTGFEALESIFGVSEESAKVAYMLGTVANDDRMQVLLEELTAADAANAGQMMAVGPRIREH